MEEIKNLMETMQKENKNAIVVWSEDTANGLSVSIQMDGKNRVVYNNGTTYDMFNSSNYECNSCRNA